MYQIVFLHYDKKYLGQTKKENKNWIQGTLSKFKVRIIRKIFNNKPAFLCLYN